MTLPPDLYDGLDPTPAASVLAYTDSCTNAVNHGKGTHTTASRAKSGTNYNRGHTWRDAKTTNSSCQTAAAEEEEEEVGVE